MDRDLARSLALASSCAAFVTVPSLGAVLASGERTDRYDTAITPPGYAFAVWAPLFAGSVVDTWQQCRAPREATSRRTGWLLTGAYALNTAWSVAAQRDRFDLTPPLLPSATTFAYLAHRRLQRLPDTESAVTPLSSGGLLGWTALASAVSLSAEARRRGVRQDSPTTVGMSSAALGVVGGLLAGVVGRARRGGAAVAATATWGLTTTAADQRRPRLVRTTAAAAALAVTGAAVRSAVR